MSSEVKKFFEGRWGFLLVGIILGATVLLGFVSFVFGQVRGLTSKLRGASPANNTAEEAAKTATGTVPATP